MHPLPHDYEVQSIIPKPTVDLNTPDTIQLIKTENESYERRLQQLFLQVESNKTELGEILHKTHVDTFNASIDTLKQSILDNHSLLMLEVDALKLVLTQFTNQFQTEIRNLAKDFGDCINTININVTNIINYFQARFLFQDKLTQHIDITLAGIDQHLYKLTKSVNDIHDLIDIPTIPKPPPPTPIRTTFTITPPTPPKLIAPSPPSIPPPPPPSP
jgi:hypothetical protein